MNGWTRWQRLTLCALIAAALYLPALGRPALWEPDEGRYAEIAREMLASGDWITPHNDWVRYFEKPPLMYWVTAGAIKVLGANEFAIRLPVALFSIAEVLVTCALAEAMFGPAVGLWAAACLGLGPLYFGFSRSLTLDPALGFFTTAALASFYATQRAAGDRRSRGWFLLAAAAMALGTLTKGPVAVVLSGGIALAWLLMEHRGRELRRIPWLGCALVYALITLPWFAAVSYRNPEFLRFFFLHEHISRYLTSTEHGWGPYFFIPVILGGMWPWIFFVPGAVVMLRDKGRESPAAASDLRFLMLWFLLIFVFFSIPRSKLGSYILPGLPPLAILAGYGIGALGSTEPRLRQRLLGLFAAVNLLLAAVAIPAMAIATKRHEVSEWGTDVIVAIGALALGAVAAFAAAPRAGKRTGTVATALTVIMAAVVTAMMVKAREDAGPLNSYRGLARAIAPHLRPGCVLASYRHHVQSLPFYTGFREALVSYRGELAPAGQTPDARASFIDSDGDLKKLWQSPACVILVANRRDLPALTHITGPRPDLLALEGKKIALANPSVRHPASPGTR